MENLRKGRRLLARVAILAAVVISVTACSHMVMMVRGTGAQKPAPSEFGLGPRQSSQGRFTATLQPAEALRPRKMQSVLVSIQDAEGQPVDGATIAVDGGMPEHGHGLPTRPRVTRSLGNGVYEIEGVRFNMGGWWELKLAISGTGGADDVTFNIEV